MGKPRITVVGSNMVDLVTYIARMPREGETLEAPRFELGFGGKGANQAAAAALLGADVAMVTRVGDDLFGPGTIANLKRLGVDTRYTEVVPGVSSGVAPIFVDPSSRNSILIIKGANARLLAADVDRAEERIAGSDLVILQLEIPLETVYHAITLCAKHAVRVILNPAPADPALDIARIAGVHLFAPNETELRTLTGLAVSTLEEVKTAARSLLGRGLDRVLVTLGDKGSLLVTAEGEIHAPPFRVDSVDTTGAGDAFVGCLAVYLVETGDLAAAMKKANKYAALSTTRPGTQKSFIGRKEFEAAAD